MITVLAVGPRMLRPVTVEQVTAAAHAAFGLAATLMVAGGPTQMSTQSRAVLLVVKFRLLVTSESKKDMPPVTVTGAMPLTELAGSVELSSLESTGSADFTRPEMLTLVADSGTSTTNPPMWGSDAADAVVLPRPKAPKATKRAATIAATPTLAFTRITCVPFY
ncbi:MAG TPA: hypothetical protein VG917_05240 [Patescibacteria group bacterium]|nr:hypothetical protein [Patescibacteria group bacterium]